jgi:3-oxoacyl-[acyl-carrier-protein] synthase III
MTLTRAQSMSRFGRVEDVRLDMNTNTAFVTFVEAERAAKLVGALRAHACTLCVRTYVLARADEAARAAELSTLFADGCGAAVLVAEKAVYVQWASAPMHAPGGGALPPGGDPSAAGMLSPGMGMPGVPLDAAAMSKQQKQEQLDYAVVRVLQCQRLARQRRLHCGACLTPTRTRTRSALR